MFHQDWRESTNMEWLIGSIYMDCEGVNIEHNKKKMNFIIEVVQEALSSGLKVILGGDMNGHIWEIDGCENTNGKLLKEMAQGSGLQILNMVWRDLMEGPTWIMNNSKYTLDYVCVDSGGLNKITEASIMEFEDVIESDHAGIKVNIEWRATSRTKNVRKKKKGKKRIHVDDWSSFGDCMDEAIWEDLSGMEANMVDIGTQLDERKKIWTENRKGWFTEEIKQHIEERKAANRHQRQMIIRCGPLSNMAIAATKDYQEKKARAGNAIAQALHQHNETVMKQITRDGNTKAIYRHLKTIINRGKADEEKEQLSVWNEDGMLVNQEQDVVAAIEAFWSKLFSLSGSVKMGIKKTVEVEAMAKGGGFSQNELKIAVGHMKSNKAIDESGIMSEYLKALNPESMRKLRRLLTEIMEGGRIPDEWKKSRVALIYKGGGEQELKNYRPIAIINVTCKMCMMMIKERLNNWMEETNFLGDIQCGFRRNRRTEDNMFMLERMMEMAAARGEELYIAFIDMEKAYDRVNRKKLFEVLRMYGVDEMIVSLIERVYEDNLVKFELGSYQTAWCDSNSGVRQGCPLSSLLFNIYLRELGHCIANCKHGFIYKVLENDGTLSEKCQAGFMYADDICLTASTKESLELVFDSIESCIQEYGLKVSERKTKVVCVNGEVQDRKWRCGSCEISEVGEYVYLGITVKGGVGGGFRSMGDRMKDANQIQGMVVCSKQIRKQICYRKRRMERYGGQQINVWKWSASMAAK